MAEYIGTTISLISKSDIRYVGRLHEINTEKSTVALEDVRSHGTEGRRGNPEDEIPPSDAVYEYIVFKGSDVKDLRIEEGPKEAPPAVPNDPAILGTGARRPPPSQAAPADRQAQGQGVASPHQQGGPPGPPPPFGQQHPQYPPPFYPPPGNWGRGGPPPHGFPPMPPYGAPPGWYPPPGQGFPQHPGPFPPYGYPPGPPGQFQGPPGQQPPPNQNQKPAPIGAGAKQPSPSVESQKQAELKASGKPSEMPAASVKKASAPSAESKVTPKEAGAGIEQPAANAENAQGKSAQPQPKSRVQPVLPLQSSAGNTTPGQGSTGNVAVPPAQATANTTLRDATQAATAAVAAAMAKLPPAQPNGNSVDNLTKKVNELRTNDPVRVPRHPGVQGTGFGQARGGRGGRGGHRNVPAGKVDVPTTDFDFESANAKFNKHDLVKEAIAGSPLGEVAPGATSPEENPTPVYNKSTSFFDNISSEAKDRAEGVNTGRPGGREWRGEEQKKNVETFGQGSVDNGYRGGYRGRGRGRGRGFRGRGYSNGPRGGYRGAGSDAQVAGQ